MTQAPMRISAGFTTGPLPIPRRRQVAQNLFRLFSVKAGMRVVTCESALEADAVLAAEGDTGTSWLCEQPLRIDRPIGKRPYYTLDLATRDLDGQVTYVEIKPEAHLVEAADGTAKPAHWDQIEAACDELGLRVDFLTDSDLAPKATLIANWRRLLPFAVLAYEDPDHELARHLRNLANGPGISIRDALIAEPARDDNIVIAHIAMLLHKGELSAPLSDETVLPATKLRSVDHEAQ